MHCVSILGDKISKDAVRSNWVIRWGLHYAIRALIRRFIRELASSLSTRKANIKMCDLDTSLGTKEHLPTTHHHTRGFLSSNALTQQNQSRMALTFTSPLAPPHPSSPNAISDSLSFYIHKQNAIAYGQRHWPPGNEAQCRKG